MSLYDPKTGPLVWPECTECNAAYMLERRYQFTDSGLTPRWVWGAVCKCGKRKKPAPAPAHLVNADGPIADERVS